MTVCVSSEKLVVHKMEIKTDKTVLDVTTMVLLPILFEHRLIDCKAFLTTFDLFPVFFQN